MTKKPSYRQETHAMLLQTVHSLSKNSAASIK